MEQRFRNMQILEYDRDNALKYAHKWSDKRNPAYLDFENYGGDCTNFASQVIFAGSGIMNYNKAMGWYYINSNDRSPSWTGVDFLYDFLVNNKGIGPFAEIVREKDIIPGDILQLSFSGGNHYNHTTVIVDTGKMPVTSSILTASHTDNTDNYPLTDYTWVNIRYIHILGVRKY